MFPNWKEIANEKNVDGYQLKENNITQNKFPMNAPKRLSDQ